MHIHAPLWYVLNEATLADNQLPLPILDIEHEHHRYVNVTTDVAFLTRTHTEKAKNWIFVKDCEAYFLDLLNAYLKDKTQEPSLIAKERVKWWDKKAKMEEIEKEKAEEALKAKMGANSTATNGTEDAVPTVNPLE